MKRLLSLIVLVGCAAEVVPGEVQIEVVFDGQGDALRVQAVFAKDINILGEVIADQPLRSTRTRLLLRPPSDADAVDASIRNVEIFVYDDANSDGTVNAGEVRGALSADGRQLSWSSLETDLESSLGSSAFSRVAIDANGFNLYDPNNFVESEIEPGQLFEISSAPSCLMHLIPECLPYSYETYLPTIRIAGPSASVRYGEPNPGYIVWPYIPLSGEATCIRIDQVTVRATYQFNSVQDVPEECRCIETIQLLNLFLGPDDRPEWLECDDPGVLEIR